MLTTPAEGGAWDVPDHVVREYRGRRTRHATVIPVLNEGDRIRGQVERMHSAGVCDASDVVIADGGSTDGSLDDGFLADNGVRAVVAKTGPGRLSAQLRCGYAWALRQGYEGIVTIDGNGKDEVEAVPAFLKLLDGGADYVQASRFMRGGRGVRTPLVRHLAVRLVHAPLLSLAAGRWFTDTTQGVRGYSRAYLLDGRVQPFRGVFADYELLAYLTVRAPQLGLRVAEVPTVRTYPAGGAVPTKITGWRGPLRLLRSLVAVCAGAYHPVTGTGEAR